jgi:hypothetical protein
MGRRWALPMSERIVSRRHVVNAPTEWTKILSRGASGGSVPNGRIGEDDRDGNVDGKYQRWCRSCYGEITD